MSNRHTTREQKTVEVQTINIGIIDRMFRFNLGFAILLLSVVTLQLGYATPIWAESSSLPMWAYIAILGSVYPLITGIFGYDPIYALFKMNTLEAFLPKEAHTHTETITVERERSTDRGDRSDRRDGSVAHSS